MASAPHVALYYPAVLPVRDYGGTERVVVWLARGLVALGCRVTVLALPGSRLAEAECIAVDPAEAFRPGGARLDSWIPTGVDILHAHVPLDQPPVGLPFLWTFHGTGQPGRRFPASTIGLSADHAVRHGLARWVHNGLDPAEYRFTALKGSADLFLGRLHSVKGWRWAVRGARRSRRPIIVAGGWRPSWRPGVRYVGKVGGARKAALLAEARCLWAPAQWDEPFGLTTIEAMVSGTPVLATRRGALPEVVTPESGALGSTLDELVALRPSLEDCDPEVVRNNVLSRFTHRHMAEAYLQIYNQHI
jgi:glycosyltransferase involved in cell wall biosynthesis